MSANRKHFSKLQSESSSKETKDISRTPPCLKQSKCEPSRSHSYKDDPQPSTETGILNQDYLCEPPASSNESKISKSRGHSEQVRQSRPRHSYKSTFQKRYSSPRKSKFSRSRSRSSSQSRKKYSSSKSRSPTIKCLPSKQRKRHFVDESPPSTSTATSDRYQFSPSKQNKASLFINKPNILTLNMEQTLPTAKMSVINPYCGPSSEILKTTISSEQVPIPVCSTFSEKIQPPIQREEKSFKSEKANTSNIDEFQLNIPKAVGQRRFSYPYFTNNIRIKFSSDLNKQISADIGKSRASMSRDELLNSLQPAESPTISEELLNILRKFFTTWENIPVCFSPERPEEIASVIDEAKTSTSQGKLSYSIITTELPIGSEKISFDSKEANIPISNINQSITLKTRFQRRFSYPILEYIQRRFIRNLENVIRTYDNPNAETSCGLFLNRPKVPTASLGENKTSTLREEFSSSLEATRSLNICEEISCDLTESRASKLIVDNVNQLQISDSRETSASFKAVKISVLKPEITSSDSIDSSASSLRSNKVHHSQASQGETPTIFQRSGSIDPSEPRATMLSCNNGNIKESKPSSSVEFTNSPQVFRIPSSKKSEERILSTNESRASTSKDDSSDSILRGLLDREHVLQLSPSEKLNNSQSLSFLDETSRSDESSNDSGNEILAVNKKYVGCYRTLGAVLDKCIKSLTIRNEISMSDTNSLMNEKFVLNEMNRYLINFELFVSRSRLASDNRNIIRISDISQDRIVNIISHSNRNINPSGFPLSNVPTALTFKSWGELKQSISRSVIPGKQHLVVEESKSSDQFETSTSINNQSEESELLDSPKDYIYSSSSGNSDDLNINDVRNDIYLTPWQQHDMRLNEFGQELLRTELPDYSSDILRISIREASNQKNINLGGISSYFSDSSIELESSRNISEPVPILNNMKNNEFQSQSQKSIEEFLPIGNSNSNSNLQLLNTDGEESENLSDEACLMPLYHLTEKYLTKESSNTAFSETPVYNTSEITDAHDRNINEETILLLTTPVDELKKNLFKTQLSDDDVVGDISHLNLDNNVNLQLLNKDITCKQLLSDAASGTDTKQLSLENELSNNSSDKGSQSDDSMPNLSPVNEFEESFSSQQSPDVISNEASSFNYENISIPRQLSPALISMASSSNRHTIETARSNKPEEIMTTDDLKIYEFLRADRNDDFSNKRIRLYNFEDYDYDDVTSPPKVPRQSPLDQGETSTSTSKSSPKIAEIKPSRTFRPSNLNLTALHDYGCSTSRDPIPLSRMIFPDEELVATFDSSSMSTQERLYYEATLKQSPDELLFDEEHFKPIMFYEEDDKTKGKHSKWSRVKSSATKPPASSYLKLRPSTSKDLKTNNEYAPMIIRPKNWSIVNKISPCKIKTNSESLCTSTTNKGANAKSSDLRQFNLSMIPYPDLNRLQPIIMLDDQNISVLNSEEKRMAWNTIEQMTEFCRDSSGHIHQIINFSFTNTILFTEITHRNHTSEQISAYMKKLRPDNLNPYFIPVYIKTIPYVLLPNNFRLQGNYFNAHSANKFMEMRKMFIKEWVFYREILPLAIGFEEFSDLIVQASTRFNGSKIQFTTLKELFPECLYTFPLIEDDVSPLTIIFENFTCKEGFTNPNPKLTFGKLELQRALNMLASFHATMLGLNLLIHSNNVPQYIKNLKPKYMKFLHQSIPRDFEVRFTEVEIIITELRQLVSTVETDFIHANIDLIRNVLTNSYSELLKRDDDYWSALCHGRAYAHNIFISYDSFNRPMPGKFVDCKHMVVRHILTDVAFLVITGFATNPHLMFQTESILANHYFTIFREKFRKCCPLHIDMLGSIYTMEQFFVEFKKCIRMQVLKAVYHLKFLAAKREFQSELRGFSSWPLLIDDFDTVQHKIDFDLYRKYLKNCFYFLLQKKYFET
ncbi:hypothetical protein ABEB36_012641 [Hypothenemus hampei]|uniref:Uncharacterized protein n=1 Tax=Hypothenemus hampei TaxID=57062 RepID=A0ABD1EBY1_HYPHA